MSQYSVWTLYNHCYLIIFITKKREREHFMWFSLKHTEIKKCVTQDVTIIQMIVMFEKHSSGVMFEKHFSGVMYKLKHLSYL